MSDAETFDQEGRDARIGRIVSELHDRRARGEPCAEAEILAAHPDIADDLRRYLAVIGGLGAADHDLDTLIAQGVLIRSDDPAYRASLGLYKVVEFLGRGGMGIVLKAYEESLNRTVALKIIRPELAGDGTALERFTREAKSAATLRHPNIVTVFAVGQERGTHFLAMEYVDGPTLADVIRQTAKPEGAPSESLSSAFVREVFRQLLEGLAAAHDAGLIHRDIKPANLLLNYVRAARVSKRSAIENREARVEHHSSLDSNVSAGSCGAGPGRHGPAPLSESPISSSCSKTAEQSPIVKIADFGLARMLTAQTRLTLDASVLGTPEYMSPEQARGGEDLDARSDLYSAGVVLYEMLTGRTPFGGGSPSTVIHRILHEAPPDPRTIRKDADANLSSLAVRLMAKRPEDRFDSASEALEALETGERVQSLERRRKKRLRRLVTGIALGSIIALAGFAFLLFGEAQAITRVRVDPDAPYRVIQVQRRFGFGWTSFHDFGPKVNRVDDVALVNVDGREQQRIVAALAGAVGQEPIQVLRLDGQGAPGYSFHSDRHWPDCQPPAAFDGLQVEAADLDGEPGDELVAVVTDAYEYPTCILVIDPRTAEVLARFWHLGNMTQILVSPDFLGPGRPAIIAWGMNNKLDGFERPQAGDAEPLVAFDWVSSLMILDPQQMEGERLIAVPPASHRIDLPPAMPWAYACLDFAPNVSVPDVSQGRDNPRRPKEVVVAEITELHVVSCSNRGERNCLRVGCCRNKDHRTGAVYVVDTTLTPERVYVTSREQGSSSEDDWRRHWRLIVQDGQYVDTYNQ